MIAERMTLRAIIRAYIAALWSCVKELGHALTKDGTEPTIENGPRNLWRGRI